MLARVAGRSATLRRDAVGFGGTLTACSGRPHGSSAAARASGVAKFTIRRVGTWEVFASYGDDVTDTVTLKK